MSTPGVLYESTLKSLPLIYRGKVRDVYDVDDHHMLIITTDRLSAFDVILPNPIPDKGRMLTTLSNFWFKRMHAVIPNHLSDKRPEDILSDADELAQTAGRAIVVRKLKALPIEAIVRGYLSGSGWKDYQKNGAVCGIKLPSGLKMADKLPEAIYTPSTKAAAGSHDQNIDFEHTREQVGDALAAQVRAVALRLYEQAAAHALQRGIIIADTKFEFGVDDDGTLTLIDEILTPDSSRFWPADQYRPGSSPPSFDKQFVRDYLETLDWNKKAPGPELPAEILRKTAEKYREALRRLTE